VNILNQACTQSQLKYLRGSSTHAPVVVSGLGEQAIFLLLQRNDIALECS
jgi:hypothetical protein